MVFRLPLAHVERVLRIGPEHCRETHAVSSTDVALSLVRSSTIVLPHYFRWATASSHHNTLAIHIAAEVVINYLSCLVIVL